MERRGERGRGDGEARGEGVMGACGEGKGGLVQGRWGMKACKKRG